MFSQEDDFSDNTLSGYEDKSRELIPIQELAECDRIRLFNKAHFRTLAPGQRIYASDELHWFVYLMKGTVEIKADPETNFVSADTPRALYPLFPEGAQHVVASARSPSVILRLDRLLYDVLQKEESIEGEEVVDIEVNETESLIFNRIFQDYSTDQLKLPSLPDVALKVREALNDPEISATEIAHIIEADPALAVQLIRTANSPLCRGVAPVGSIREAVVRLGLLATRNLVISFTIKQLFKAKSPVLRKRMQQLYSHSVQIAALSFALGRESSGFLPEHALLAGLIHDIGVIPVLTYMDEMDVPPIDPNELEGVIGKLRGLIGGMLLRHWNFEPEFVDVAEHAEEWTRDAGSRADCCDLVIIAQLYSDLEEGRFHMPLEQVPAFNKLAISEEQGAFFARVLDEAKEEIAEIQRLLKG